MFPSNKLSPRHQSCPGVVLIRYMEIPRVHQGVKAHVDQMRCPRHQLRQAFRHGPHLPQQVGILGGFGDVNQEMDAERVAGAQKVRADFKIFMACDFANFWGLAEWSWRTKQDQVERNGSCTTPQTGKVESLKPPTK